jgi:hypothetical protein
MLRVWESFPAEDREGWSLGWDETRLIFRERTILFPLWLARTRKIRTTTLENVFREIITNALYFDQFASGRQNDWSGYNALRKKVLGY